MRPFRKKPPVKKLANYAFIDSQNLNLGTQKMGWKMDWKKFRIWLEKEYNVEKAFMFIGYMPNYEDLYEQLHSQGYLVVLKPTIEMFRKEEDDKDKKDSKEDNHVAKGNVDTDLVLHVMKEYKNYDKAVIVSGDGDFYTLLEYLKSKNKLYKLLTPNWQYSSLLKHFEEYIVRLDQKRSELRYPDRRKKHHKNSNSNKQSTNRRPASKSN